MDDIKTFLKDYREAGGIKPHDWMFGIPVIGKKMHESAFLENKKRDFFERKYQQAVNGTAE